MKTTALHLRSNSISHRRSLLVAIGILLATAWGAFAANPNQGTLNPGSATALQWVGDALGGPAITTETACQDGSNWEVCTLHLYGNASDYDGKALHGQVTV